MFSKVIIFVMLLSIVVAAEQFNPPRVTLDAKVSHWGDENKDEVYTPGGQAIASENKGGRDPVRVDTMVQMDDGEATIDLNRYDMRYTKTAPSDGYTPKIFVTGYDTDTTMFTYRGSIVAHSDNRYIKIVSSDTLDTSWVSVMMIVR